MKSSPRRESHRRSLGNDRRRKSFLKGMQRRLFAEQLESRVLLAGDVLQNTDNPYDTDRNGVFSPADILHVINQLNRAGAPASGEGEGGTSPTYYNDVNGDGFVSPIDALHGINEYSYRAEGEGELVSFRIQAVDVGTGNIINTSNPSGPNFHPVVKGDDYELRVIVDDLRLPGGPDGNPDGVYAAYMDLLYQKLNTVVEIQEIQTLTFGNAPEGGTFRLSFNSLTTADIAYANPFVPGNEFVISSNIQNALNTTFGANRFQVTPVSAGDATQFSIRFMGQFGDTDVPLMTGNGAGLTSSSSSPPFPMTFVESVKGVYSPASFLAAFRFGAQYQSGKVANDGQLSPTVDPNRIDEVGAFYTST
ncbi:MAG: hypothetical protein IAF94_08730, partial [Pirellulaceae bacterium]|nr:hypothetical protein [Pirellulaceae bacterium]